MKAREFVFKNYEVEKGGRVIDFYYTVKFRGAEDLEFKESVELPESYSIKGLPPPAAEKILAGLHLMIGVSYYKTFVPPAITHKYSLTADQAEYWNAVYRQGLGEFYWRNKIDPKLGPNFTGSSQAGSESLDMPSGRQCLIGVGGGKDSIVVGELLKKAGYKICGFTVETESKNAPASMVAEKMDIEHLIVKRVIDGKLRSGLPGAYQGHIPISGVYAWVGLLLAAIGKYGFVVMGNEYSSNFGNVKYKSVEINHQWSKSAEFEALFQSYTDKYVVRGIKYFSLLRPFYELRIAAMFSRYPQYFSIFSSCNESAKDDFSGAGVWCGKCAKCAFVFAMLVAFNKRERVVGIFKKDLLADKKLVSLYGDLLGLGRMKPFDCVGTFEEMRAAIHMAAKQYKDSPVINKWHNKIKIKKAEIAQLMIAQRALTVPSRFRFLGMEKVLTLGYGREGKTTERYLMKKYPQIKIGIADKKRKANYVRMQRDFDIVVKTPGINKRDVSGQYTTATNMFFANISSKTVGITGTQGKSTMASLLYHVLKSVGVKARLVGNIGEPMLRELMRPHEKGEVIVVELSSYQLDDIEYSPNIAVLLNLYPDHMDYHGSVEEYYRAKKNILKFQSKDDYVLYNGADKTIAEWAEQARGKPFPIEETAVPEAAKDINLIGRHNDLNIAAAVTAAKIIGVKKEAINNALATFKGLPHRLEYVGEYNKIHFYDDAIATTPQATIAALDALPRVDTLLIGGQNRGYDFTELGKHISAKKIKNLVLFPDSGREIVKNKDNYNVLQTESMKEAVSFAWRHTLAGGICLLSTASPSYSLWADYEEKGNLFKEAIIRKSKSHGRE